LEETPMKKKEIKQRLEYLRGELRAERISQGELLELESLAEHIEPGDVELLEAAGVPEQPDDRKEQIRVVVELYGGLVQQVFTDADVQLDVVFTEDPKYGSDDPAEGEHGVKSGPLQGMIVYTHHESEKRLPKHLDPVFQAAAEREKAE
jgi:hypothetical protein